VAFLVDVALLLYEIVSDRWTSLVLVAVNEVCIISMLACFEQINEIAQLERQILAFTRRSEEVEERKKEARSNWEQVKQLHDLWLYRTLPSLAIMGKIHNHLADEDMAVANGDASRDSRPGFLRLANESLEVLELKLGPIEKWRGTAQGESWKASIGKQLKDCENESDLTKLLSRLPIITQDLSLLEAPPPSFTEDLTAMSTPSSTPRVSPRDSPEQTSRSDASSSALGQPKKRFR